MEEKQKVDVNVKTIMEEEECKDGGGVASASHDALLLTHTRFALYISV